jgi:hypothetical protein
MDLLKEREDITHIAKCAQLYNEKNRLVIERIAGVHLQIRDLGNRRQFGEKVGSALKKE